jgi:hypothetical protein
MPADHSLLVMQVWHAHSAWSALHVTWCTLHAAWRMLSCPSGMSSIRRPPFIIGGTQDPKKAHDSAGVETVTRRKQRIWRPHWPWAVFGRPLLPMVETSPLLVCCKYELLCRPITATYPTLLRRRLAAGASWATLLFTSLYLLRTVASSGPYVLRLGANKVGVLPYPSCTLYVCSRL